MENDNQNKPKDESKTGCLIGIIIILVLLVFTLWGAMKNPETDLAKAKRMCSELVVEKGTNDSVANGKMYSDCLRRFGYDPTKAN